ncbi:NnrS family protein [Pseudoduganella danionis]|uniref:NnrS family protein n=1 Tax=Pseudoduganella danionis TaxID=1890295 RepID=UPI0035B3D919
MSLLSIDEPPAVRHTGHPVWRLGFRPFYLCAAFFAALAIPVWMAQYYGWIPQLASVALHVGFAWHMHEMVFGMGLAVVIGFLYTAAYNWTGFWTPVRGHLAALVALWLAGRLAMLLAPPMVAALIDWPFIPAAAWPLLQVMRKANNRRNYFLVGILGLLAMTNGVFHAIALGWHGLQAAAPIHAAIFLIVVIEAAIGTRIIPMFTRNGAPGSSPLVQPKLDKVSLGLLVLSACGWLLSFPAWLFGPLALLAAGLILLRLWRWDALSTLTRPLLWIMHLSYAWIAAGLVLLALARWQLVSSSTGFHALTVGSMAGLILGMMTRTTLGHTGRPLVAGRAETLIFVLIQASAFLRVGTALGWETEQGLVMLLAASCWTLGFASYVVVYLPYLTSPRLDGKAG